MNGIEDFRENVIAQWLDPFPFPDTYDGVDPALSMSTLP